MAKAGAVIGETAKAVQRAICLKAPGLSPGLSPRLSGYFAEIFWTTGSQISCCLAMKFCVWSGVIGFG